MVGIAENVGHAKTYKVLTVNTQKIIYHSNLHSASSADHNQHVTLLGGEPSSQSAPPAAIKSHHDDADGEPKDHNMPIFSPINLVGHTFLLEPCEDRPNSVHVLSRPLKIMRISWHNTLNIPIPFFH